MFRARSTLGDRYFMVAVADLENAKRIISGEVGQDEIIWDPLPDQVFDFLNMKEGDVRQWV
jgi:hypothetical protein